MSLILANITKDSLLDRQLETAYLVTDWYRALLTGKTHPCRPFPELEEALKAHRVLSQYINNANLGIKQGLRLVNSSLTTDQIVWTWQRYCTTVAKHRKGIKKQTFN